MTEQAHVKADGDGGFWRLQHDHLAALLCRRDLSWEVARVYLALADLTLGYGKERDTVSLGQIADRAGMFAKRGDVELPDYPHVRRALNRLSAVGLYGQIHGKGQNVVRWVVWPAPNNQETTADAGSFALVGSSTTAETGNDTTAKAIALTGKHQDTKKGKKYSKKIAADKTPPDPRVKEFIDWFWAEYQRDQGRPYVVTGGKDGLTVKWLLQSLSVEDLQEATRNMLADPWGKAKASIGLLSSQINAWRGQQNPRAQASKPGGFTPAKSDTNYGALAQKF